MAYGVGLYGEFASVLSFWIFFIVDRVLVF